MERTFQIAVRSIRHTAMIFRFGRDYLTVGNYINKIFPFMGVRFIAINDGLDSDRPENVDSLDTSFKALLYDLYSRDLSRKVRKAKRFRAQRGDFMAPFAPYGYVKSPENHNQLVIDPPAAEIVRRVFRMIAEGHSAIAVARKMNNDGVLTPMLYKRSAGCSRTRWSSVNEDNFWTDTIVTKIIRDERYIGTNTYGKRVRDMVGSTHKLTIDDDIKLFKELTVCAKCGKKVTRRTDSRLAEPVSWKCPECGWSVRMPDTALKVKVVEVMNALIANPERGALSEPPRKSLTWRVNVCSTSSIGRWILVRPVKET